MPFRSFFNCTFDLFIERLAFHPAMLLTITTEVTEGFTSGCVPADRHFMSKLPNSIECWHAFVSVPCLSIYTLFFETVLMKVPYF